MNRQKQTITLGKDVFMQNSIQQFLSEGIEKIVEIFNKGYENPQDMYSVITGVFKEMDALAMNILADYIKSVDQAIFEDRMRKQHYKSEGFDDRTLITSRGEIRFPARWYTDKETNQSICLLEKVLGLHKDERVTEEAQVKILERCAEHSYRESGCLADVNEQLLSKQTVKTGAEERSRLPVYRCRRRPYRAAVHQGER